MRKYLSISLSVLALICMTSSKASAQVSTYYTVKTAFKMTMGFDLGLTFNERFGFKAGMLSDLHRPDKEDGNVISQYEEVLGKPYRLAYTAGPIVKITDWMWIGATAGYGEYGTYGYSSKKDMYGIRGKIKGFEAGLQLTFVFEGFVLDVGYETVPKGFAAGRPLNEIVIGFGMMI